MDLVEAVHTQCHEHLRDADKKRDELIGFFAVVVGLLFATYEKVDSTLRPLLAIVVALVGLFVVLTVLQYRKWHTIYTHCFKTLERATWRNPRVTKADIEIEWAKLKIPTAFWSKALLLNPFGGTEGATFGALLVLSFLPWYLVPRAVPQLVLFHVPNDVIGFTIGFVIYLLFVSLVGMMIFYRADKLKPFDHWVLRPFDD